MAPAPAPFVSDQNLPKKAGVVVIGGGIIGVATTLELAERGINIVLCEKGIIAGEQSSRNWGWCRQMGRDVKEIPLAKLSLGLWRKLNQRTGQETGFRQCGIVCLCDSDRELAARAKWYEDCAKPHGLSTRMLSPAEADALAPANNRSRKGGLYTLDDGRAEPQLATAAMANAAQKKGARFFTNCAIRGIETTAGRVSGVVSENGKIACDTVVLAGGAWSRRFCTNAGLELPQLTVINSAQRTEPLDTPITISMANNEFALRKRLDGGYTIAHARLNMVDIVPDSFRLFGAFLPRLKDEFTNLRFRIGRRFIDEARLARRWHFDQISPFELVRILDPKPSRAMLNHALASLQKDYPVFKKALIKEQWAGVIDVTPDAVPVISAVDNLPGFFLATGFSGHGFGIGPGAGRLAADLVTGARPCVDPTPFSFDRF